MSKPDTQLCEELENRIRFETLIADISARFVRVPSEEVDCEIERALKQVLEFFDVDRCGLLGMSEDKKFVRTTHACYAKGTESVSKEYPVTLFPWAYDILIQKGLPLKVNRMTELPPEAEQDRISWSAMGTKSNIIIPLLGTRGIRHLMIIHSVYKERDWPEEYVSRLKLLGEIFINALERRNADQTIRESESRLHLAADSAGAGLWILDIATGGFWLTDKTRELFGFPSDRMIYMGDFLDIVHPEDREKIHQAIHRAQHSKEIITVQYRILRPDGSIRWIVSRGGISSGDKEETSRLMGVSLDITERKQLENEVKKAVEEWRATFDTIQDLIMVLDCEFRIIRVNRAVEAFLSLPAENILGRHYHTFLPAADMPAEGCPVTKALKTQQHAEAEVHFDKKNIWLLISATPMYDEKGNMTGFIQTAKDITEHKRTEEEILRLHEEYAHIARVSAMGELTASLAHELKQPLAAIRSNAQAALRFLTSDKPDMDELHEVLKDIISDDRRADEVIKKLRALMRKSKLQITDLNMKEAVQDILSLIARHENLRKISLRLELDETIPPVAGDRIQIQQVILNLILNSTEALMSRKQPSRSILVRTFQPDSRTVTLSVKDNGPGIKENVMPHLFEAFYTTKEEGLGMGLSISRSIVEEHGGRLWAENNPDGGATFSFTIPIAREDLA